MAFDGIEGVRVARAEQPRVGTQARFEAGDRALAPLEGDKLSNTIAAAKEIATPNVALRASDGRITSAGSDYKKLTEDRARFWGVVGGTLPAVIGMITFGTLFGPLGAVAGMIGGFILGAGVSYLLVKALSAIFKPRQ